jgi:acyl-[acyl-carrier-protein] desaturase
MAAKSSSSIIELFAYRQVGRATTLEPRMNDEHALRELAPVAERLLERHLATAREWQPHEYIPWSRGRDFEPGEEWEETPATPPAAIRSALFVNLLTEDNLPYYFGTIDRVFGTDHPWREWVRRWTAEEMRHALVIRDYVVVTRAIDPVALERARMHQVSTGEVPEPPDVAEALVYVALQELATRIAHRNTGKLLEDPRGYDVLSRVAADENLHYLFYRDLCSAAIDLDPSSMVIAMANQVPGFQMPGTGIPDFASHARVIAAAGIYDLAILREQVLMPVVLGHWRLKSLENLTPEAEKAREVVVRHVDRLGKIVARQAERKAQAEARAAAEDEDEDERPVSATG